MFDMSDDDIIKAIITRFQIRRGPKDSLFDLRPGEFGYATDTREIYIGLPDRNVIKVMSEIPPTGATGPTGSRGLLGLTGPTGPIGHTGPTGAVWKPIINTEGEVNYIISDDTTEPTPYMIKGDTGPKGDKGEEGTSFLFLPSVNNINQLPNKGEEGNVIVVNNILYQWDAILNEWVKVAEIDLSHIKGDKGDKGNTGPKGDKGDKGNTGNIGPTGPQGPKGDQGIKGATGPKGETGAKGPTGATGERGPQGPRGLNGPMGTTGSKGNTGPAGPKGDGFNFKNSNIDSVNKLPTNANQGDVYNVNDVLYVYNDGRYEIFCNIKGSTGPTGPKGATGQMGPRGVIGPTGPQGIQGVKGNKGDTGPKGDKGDKGNTGDIGPTGPIGKTGPLGPTGATGPTGPIGIRGNTGATGPMGPVGPKGQIGAVGPTGPRGVTGPQGEEGPMGPMGVTGPKGATGAQGPTGATGVKGDTGVQGLQGPRGSTGAVGPKGATGPQGIQGVKGATGDKGATGTTGPTGANGISPNLKVGTVTTLNAGEPVSVTMSGTFPNILLNFALPGSTPAASSDFIYYGRLTIADVGGSIKQFSAITSSMITSNISNSKIKKVSASKITAMSMGKENSTAVGDYIIVAVPHNSYKVYMINSFGTGMPFYTDISGANGNVQLTIDGKSYDLYGQIIPSKGEMYITIV